MLKKTMICAASALTLAACGPDGAVEQQPVAASFATKAGFDTTRILRTELVTIAASTPQKKGIATWDKAVAGANCVAESAEITVAFTTPSQVKLPVIKGRPSPMTISCTTGVMSGAVRTQPTLIESNESGNAIFDQQNIVAGVIVGAIGAAIERREARANDAWRFVEVSQGVSLQ